MQRLEAPVSKWPVFTGNQVASAIFGGTDLCRGTHDPSGARGTDRPGEAGQRSRPGPECVLAACATRGGKGRRRIALAGPLAGVGSHRLRVRCIPPVRVAGAPVGRLLGASPAVRGAAGHRPGGWMSLSGYDSPRRASVQSA